MDEVQAYIPTWSFVYSRKAHGFFPKSIFYKDETANPANEKEVLFFQDFGIPPSKDLWKSMDEELVVAEITYEDLWKFRTGLYGIGWSGSAYSFFLARGYSLPGECPVREQPWIPWWPPIPFPEESPWVSVLQEKDIKRIAFQRKIEELEQSILTACVLCMKGSSPLALKDGMKYTHGRTYSALKACGSHKMHLRRGSIAPDIMKREREREPLLEWS